VSTWSSRQAKQPPRPGGASRSLDLVTGLADVAVRCPLFASRLVVVAEPSSWGVPAREPDRLIKWSIGVVVIAVAVNLLSGFVVAQKWAWLLPVAFVAALLVAVPSTGLLRRERYRTTRARGMALLALTGYLAVTV
jgi:hypothetical protein